MARLKLTDRYRISELYLQEKSAMEIAAAVGVSLNTVYTELQRGRTEDLDKNMRNGYDPELAQRRVQANLRHCGSRRKRV